tara:strand:+ start:2315 stop:2908 length:594 start_codon:yes stop_codon:yes gene_type:complete
MYYETDTNKIILYDGTDWREYNSDVETTIEETINITYDSLENILAGSNYKLGDMFAADPTISSAKLKQIDTPVNNTYIYLTDSSGNYTLYRMRTSSVGSYVDYDPANYGTSSWSGFANLKTAIESDANHSTTLTCTVSGDYNEYLHIDHINPGSDNDARLYTNSTSSCNSQTFTDGHNQRLLFYLDENQFVELSENE